MLACTTFAVSAQQLAGRGWRPFPGYQETKRPAMLGWSGLNEARWDPDDLAATISDYAPPEKFCCCLAVQPETVVLDLDIEDPLHAEFAKDLRDHVFGETPLIRIGYPPKSIAIYRNAGGIVSRKSHPLEIFSGSGQFIAYGWHARANGPYVWPKASPLDLGPDSLEIPLISPHQIESFTRQLFEVVPRRISKVVGGCRMAGNQTLTVGDYLRALVRRYGSFYYAAKVVLRAAEKGNRNETGWTVIASAVGRGLTDHEIFQLFEENFSGWDGFTPNDLKGALLRLRSKSHQNNPRLKFGTP